MRAPISGLSDGLRLCIGEKFVKEPFLRAEVSQLHADPINKSGWSLANLELSGDRNGLVCGNPKTYNAINQK